MKIKLLITMIQKFFLTLNIIVVFNSIAGFTECNQFSKRGKHNTTEPEGYILLDVKVFTDVDSNGIATNPISGNDSIMFSSHRKMYIKNYLLIDIIENEHFSNGEYTKADTSSYNFYDLANQKYVLFEKLTTDAKIIKRGSMAVGGFFSNTAQYDPWNGIVDSTWELADTVINGKRQGVINFILTGITDSLDKVFAHGTKFWVDHETKNFPLQLSYILSKKLNGVFVYKWQGLFPDGKAIMVTSLDYQPAKLPDTLTRIFEKWTQIARE